MSRSILLSFTLALLLPGFGCSAPSTSETPPIGGGRGGNSSIAGAGGTTAEPSAGSGQAGSSGASGGTAPQPAGGNGGNAAAGGEVAGAGGTAPKAGASGMPTSGGAAGTPAGGSAGTATAGQAGLGGTPAGGGSGQAGAASSGDPPDHREFILYNDANGGQLLYVNNTTPEMNWTANSGSGRDMQLVGNGRVMLGKSGGWDEYQLSDGSRVGGVSSLSGTQTTHRLADGTTLVASTSGNSIRLRFADTAGAVQREITYAGYNYVRCVRPTSAGTFLVTADVKVFEGNADGEVIWEVTIPGSGHHVWKAMRLRNGNTAVTTGYDRRLRVYDAEGMLVQTIGDAPEVTALVPKFFADFHVMPNGNYFVVNSQADSPDPASTQLLEFSPAGMLVWKQKQPMGVGSLEAAIVLDGLDTSKLHVELEGQLVAVP